MSTTLSEDTNGWVGCVGWKGIVSASHWVKGFHKEGFCLLCLTKDRDAMVKFIKENWPERVAISGYCIVSAFNDHPQTTFEDIEKCLSTQLKND